MQAAYPSQSKIRLSNRGARNQVTCMQGELQGKFQNSLSLSPARAVTIIARRPSHIMALDFSPSNFFLYSRSISDNDTVYSDGMLFPRVKGQPSNLHYPSWHGHVSEYRQQDDSGESFVNCNYSIM